MRTAFYVSNIIPSTGSNKSQLEKFAGVAVSPLLKYTYTFGCPVFVLQSSLAENKTIPKLDARARCGMYFGSTPSHTWSVLLVLNLTTGLVSPQFHDIFDKIKALQPSAWQCLSRFEFEEKLKKSGKTKVAIQQLMLPVQSASLYKGVIMVSSIKTLNC